MGLYSPSAPPPRDIGEETRDTLQAQIDLAPDIFEARANDEYGDPALARLELGILQELAPGYLELFEGDLAPGMRRIQAANDAAQRESDVSALELYGGRVSEALRRANPNQAALLDELNSQALSDLRLGSSLSGEDAREATQAARAAYASRGRLSGNAAVSAEVLNRYGLGRQREAERRNFASGVVGMNATTMTDPAMAILGRPSMSAGAAGPMAGALGGMTRQSATQFDPFNAYASDLYNTNYNAANARSISGANNAAGIVGGALSAAKIFFMCVPEGQRVDLPGGRSAPIQTVRAGDIVLGEDGEATTVLQVHQYVEDPASRRWRRIHLDGGRVLATCDLHLVGDSEDQRPAGEVRPRQRLAGIRVVAIEQFGGVGRSYDLLTGSRSGGYRIAGVPVQTMIPHLVRAAAQLEER